MNIIIDINMSLIKVENCINNAEILVDFLGNIFLKHNDYYYYISLNNDLDCGIELIRILNINKLKKNYEFSSHLKNLIKSGEIMVNGNTLQGKVASHMNDTNQEDNNEYNYTDKSYHERKYFKTIYDDSDNEENDDDIKYYINGVCENNETHGIKYADLLFSSANNYETILIDGNIESHKVISTVEKKDGYCDSRLSIYTNGIMRCNFFDVSKWAKIYYENNELCAKFFMEHHNHE